MSSLMEQDQDFKFICKLCNQKYPCGKSLGGHMRSHLVVPNSPESEDNNNKFEPSFKKFSSPFGDFVANGQTSYGLRENPKKTWRATDSNVPLPQEKVCKQCGKGFQSLKALCGHMACHSDRDRGAAAAAAFKDDNSWTSTENQKLVVDSYSDTEEGEEMMRLRTRSSKGKRQRKVMDYKCNSSSVSEIDGQEQEEVAMCLMMLSRDSGHKGGVNSVVESSDNNSVVLETKSSSFDMKAGKNGGGLNPECSPKKTEEAKLKGRALDGDFAQTENSDSGYFLDECAKAESEVSVDAFRRSYSFRDSKRLPIMSYEERGEEVGNEFRKSLNRLKNSRTEFSKSTKDQDYYEDGIQSSRVVNNSTANAENSQKRSKYECFNCRRSFKSYQALGGHRPCHKRSAAYYESTYSGENSLDDSTEFRAGGKVVESTTNRKASAKNSSQDKKTKAKKNKGHVCPFCNRVFKNGQALGGHKRSHFLGGHEETSSHVPVKKPELPDFIDLNLPAPEEDDDEARGQYYPW